MPLIVAGPGTRRHALLIGVSRYLSKEWNQIAKGVEEEIAQAKLLFQQKLEYNTCEVVDQTDRANIGDRVVAWSQKHASIENDVCVIYYTGHGFIDHSKTLRLITSDIKPGMESTAPAARDFVDWLGEIKASALVIIDTCYSSAVAVDAHVLQERAGDQTGKTRQIQFITSARSVEEARPGWFIEALSRALDDVASQDHEFAPMEEVLATVNRLLAKKSLALDLERKRQNLAAASFSDPEIRRILDDYQRKDGVQHARFSGAIEELSQFFPNQNRLEFTRRLDSQRAMSVLHRVQTYAFRNHWDPRARGIASGTQPGWFFSGRHRALIALKSKIAIASGGRILVVCGMAGSGKSALLARFVTLADPEVRQRAEQAGATDGVPVAALPDLDCVDIAVWAAARSDVSVAMEIATALGGELARDWDDPVTALTDAFREQSRTHNVLVLDSLDEAENPLKLAFILRELAKATPALRIVVGIRTGQSGSSEVLSRLGSNVEALNLDSDEYWDQNDIESFVERYLTEQDASPYASMPDYVQEVARAVASRAQRSFLVASTTARALANQSQPLAREELKNLPARAGEAFEMDLKRFGSEWRQGIRVIGALAYGRGRGLPRALWPAVAAALTHSPGGSEIAKEIEYWETAAEVYLLRESIGGEVVYRLYHPEFAQHLRIKIQQFHVMCTNPACPHTTPETCIATALLAGINGDVRPVDLSIHLLEHLPGYLEEGGLAEPLYELVTATWWQDAKKRVHRDPVSLVDDFGKAIGLARRDPPNILRIVRLCAMLSRQVSPAKRLGALRSGEGSFEAPSIVIDTLARAGQLDRARLMADNVLT